MKRKPTNGATSPGRRHVGMRVPVVAAVGVAALVLTACGSSGGSGSNPTAAASGSSQQNLTKITVSASFPYAAGQYSCLYDYGKAKGFFAKQGLDPSFTAAKGSANLIAEVAAGKLDFGFSAATANVVQAVNKGAAVKIIGVQESKSPTAVISKKSDPITKPADLKGKKIAYGASTLGGIGLQVLLKQNNIPASDVTVVNVQPTAYYGALKSGTIDGFVSFPTSAFPTLEKLGVTPEQMPLRDFGFNPVPNDTYIASDDYISKNPKVVKEFLAAVHETWAYMHANLDTAAKAAAENCVSKHVGVKTDLAEPQIKLVVQLADAQLSEKNFMKVDQSDLDKQLTLLKQVGQITSAKPASDYFTNKYLPSAG